MYISILLLTFMFLMTMHPMTLGLILITQTICMSLYLALNLKTFWFLYLLMLTFIGGMLIMFIYVTSILPNLKFFINQFNLISIMSMLIPTAIIFMLNFDYLFLILNPQEMLLNYLNPNLFSTNKLFFFYTNFMTLMLVNYLFYCMIIVVKITNLFSGPLRKSY